MQHLTLQSSYMKREDLTQFITHIANNTTQFIHTLNHNVADRPPISCKTHTFK